MVKALVTGASGFVGSHLVEALVARGDEVTCLVRATSRTGHLEDLGVRLALGEVADAESLAAAVAGQDVVFHVAGLTRALRVADLHRVNVQGARHAAEACARRPSPPVLVLVSSLAAAGPAPAERPRTEEDPARPVSHYGRSKRGGELAVAELADRVPITVVRPPMVFGPRDRDCLEWFKAIRRFRVHLVPGWRRRRYSIIHGGDLARLLLLAADRGGRVERGANEASFAAGCYLADCGERPALGELGRMIARAVDRRVLVWHLAMPWVWTAASVVEAVSRARGRMQPLNLDKIREVTAGDWVCSGRKAAEELGFQVATPLEERVRQTAAWYRQEGWL